MFNATEGSALRSRLKRPTSSAARCWASAALPPLPHQNTVRPSSTRCRDRLRDFGADLGQLIAYDAAPDCRCSSMRARTRFSSWSWACLSPRRETFAASRNRMSDLHIDSVFLGNGLQVHGTADIAGRDGVAVIVSRLLQRRRLTQPVAQVRDGAYCRCRLRRSIVRVFGELTKFTSDLLQQTFRRILLPCRVLHAARDVQEHSFVIGDRRPEMPAHSDRSTMNRFTSTKSTFDVSPTSGGSSARRNPDIGSTPRRSRWRYTPRHPRPVPKRFQSCAHWPSRSAAGVRHAGPGHRNNPASAVLPPDSPIAATRAMAAARLSRSARFATQPVNSATRPRCLPDRRIACAPTVAQVLDVTESFCASQSQQRGSGRCVAPTSAGRWPGTRPGTNPRTADAAGLRTNHASRSAISGAGRSRRSRLQQFMGAVDQLAIPHPRRTDGFASLALQTAIQMTDQCGRGCKPILRQSPDQRNAAAGAFRLLAGIDIGRTDRKTHAAGDASVGLADQTAAQLRRAIFTVESGGHNGMQCVDVHG